MPQDAAPPTDLEQVDEALARYAPTLDAALDAVLDQAVTDYPVLVWGRDAEVELGVELIPLANPGGWTVRMTTLEELSAKQLLRPERVADFRRVFSDAREQYCLFVITSDEARFAFRPRG